MRQGHRAIRRDALDPATKAFEQALAAAPDDRRTHIQLALAQARRGDCAAVRTSTATMLGRFPDDPLICLFAGRCLLECDEPANAEPLLRSAAERQPGNHLAQQYLGLCELINGKMAEAAERFDRVGMAANADFLALLSHEVERRLAPRAPVEDKEIAPTSESLASLLAQFETQAAGSRPRFLVGNVARRRIVHKMAWFGERAYDRGEFAEALAAFEAARRCDPKAVALLLGGGLSALALERPNQAAQLLGEAYRHSPDDGFAASNYANALYRSGRFAEALAVLEAVVPAGPDDFHAYYGKGACLAALGRKADSLAQFRIAFERYRLDSMDDCFLPSWEQLRERETPKAT